MKRTTVLKRVVILVAVLATLFSLSATVSAARVPTDAYTYWQKGDTGAKEAVTIRPLYTAEEVIDGNTLGIGAMVSPKYMAVDNNGFLYVLDSGNGRIVVLDTDMTVLQTIEEVYQDGEAIPFMGAGGLSVTKDHLYIADTDGGRVLVCSRSLNVEQVITKPDSYLIPENFPFKPTRVVCDNKGFLYVLCEGSYYGTMMFTDTYEFLGFYGANLVEGDVLSAIKEWFQSIFMTDAKQEGTTKKLPYQVTDVTLGPDGFLYTSTEGGQWSFTRGEIRKMGPGGGNILKFSSNLSSMDADDFRFTDMEYNYNTLNTRITPAIAGLSVDADGFIYAVDRATGKILIYDQMCNLLTTFGGGIGTGTQLGTFVTPVSVVGNGEEVYVLDTIHASITVFRLTEFGRKVRQADILSLDGDHAQAKPLWQEVLEQEQNYQIALVGLGKAALGERDYETAMEYAQLGLDQETYISAFKSTQSKFLEKNFIWLFFGILLAIVGLSVFFIISRKREIVLVRHEQLRHATSVLTHPFVSFNSIRQTPRLSMWIPTAILFLFFLGKMAEKEYAGFMYVLPSKESSLLFTLIGTVGLAVLGVFCNWGISVLFEGKGKLKQCYCALCYCLVPQIVGSIAYVALTYLVVPTGGSVLTIVQMIITIITVIWLLLAITIVHEFSFFKAIGALIGTILAMCLVGFIAFLLVVLAQDVVTFVGNLFKEAFYR